MTFGFDHVCLESFGLHLPTEAVTSAALEERLAPLYRRLDLPFGTLERVSGVKTRHFFAESVTPSKAGAQAVQEAIMRSGLPESAFGALLSCSVTRDYFEPATASLIQRAVGLSENLLSFDVSNACVGFSNGLILVSNMIESGMIRAGIVVSAEVVSKLVNTCLETVLAADTITRAELLTALPTLTLGSGAVAVVLCHEDLSQHGHRIRGGAARSASEFNHLCVGNADYCHQMNFTGLIPTMHTESATLISSAACVGARTWAEASAQLHWTADDISHLFTHQVGRQVNGAFWDKAGLAAIDPFHIYPRYGNQVSAAMPTSFALGLEECRVQNGDKILLAGFGSGLNTVFTGIEW